MMQNMDQEYKGICQICLRIDKKVHKTKRSNLTRFYRELCNSSEISFCDPGVQCCFECEYLLLKMYNFKQKCVIASNILESWRASKLKEPLNTIYEKLPPTSLGLWIPDNSKVFYYQEGEFGTTTIKLENDVEIREDTQYDELPEISDDIQHFEVPPNNQAPKSNKKTPSILEATLTNKRSRLSKNTSICAVTQSIIGVSESKNIPNESSKQAPVLWKYLSRNEFTPNLEVTESKTEVLPNTNMPKSGSTTCLNESKVGQYYTKSNTQQTGSAFDPIVTNNNKLGTNGPVLCLQDIFASLTAGNKQTENDLLDDDNLHIKEDHDYCEPEGVPQPSTRKRRRAREALKITKKPKVRKVYKKKRKEIHFSKENFKVLLREYFSLCGELKTFNGTTIDKDFILSLVDHKLSERRMQMLWKLIYGTSKMKPGVRRILGIIQNSYKNDDYESVFNIVYLNTEEDVRREFQNRKTYKCYMDAKYKCEICYEGFTHEKRLSYHQKSHDESTGNVVCDICSKRFPDKKRLTVHRPLHEIVFKCKLCPLVTIYRIAMINHFNQHNGMQYQCTFCHGTFKSMSVFITHCNNFCKGAPNFCTICGRKFVKESVLKLHLAKDHKDEPPTDPESSVQCPHCMVGFSTERAMNRHCHNTHGKRQWLVTSTRKSTSKKTPGERATRTKKTDNPRKPIDRRHTCQLCNEVCENKYWLKLHFTAKHPLLDMESFLYPTPQPYLCHICGRSFKVYSALFDHLNSHSGKRPFECPECHKRFQRKVGLVHHMLFHRPPEQVCYVCGKMFKTTVNLMIHMRIHKNDRRYKCHICGKGFIQSYALQEHVRGVHQQIRRVKKKRVAVAPEAKEIAYSGNECDGNALNERVSGVNQKIRRVEKKRDEIAPEATELVYSDNESDENALSEYVNQKIRRVEKKRDEIAPEATELVYSDNESEENALSDYVRGVDQKIRRVEKKREEIAPEATELVYSDNESEENALSEYVRGVDQKRRRVEKKREEIASEATELVYSDNESEENALSEYVRGVDQKIRRVEKKRDEIAPEATELVYSDNESEENALGEYVRGVDQKRRRVEKKREEIASEATELVYSDNESEENALSEYVRGVDQKIRRVEKKRDEIAPEATELVYRGNESDDNASSEYVRGVDQKRRRVEKKREEIASEATELVYSDNESEENALSEYVRGVDQKIRRVEKKRDEIAPEATELVYSDNESEENALGEYVRGVDQKRRRVEKKREEIASEATELVYSDNESEENALSEYVRGVDQKIRRVEKKRDEIAPEATELVYRENESDENASSEYVKGVDQKRRRVINKRDEIAPEATDLVYSDNESGENYLSERVRTVHQKIRRVEKKRDEIAPEATELVYSGNESDENA